MIEIDARLHELRALGLHHRTRLVSGPQGPHVVLDGKPVLLLCSNNYLGLADHRAGELRAAARVLALAAREAGIEAVDQFEPAPAQEAAGYEPFDYEARAA